MRILRHIPCLAILLVLYNVLTLIPATAKGFSANISVVQVPLPRTGASVLLTVSEVFAMLGIICLYFEILKATRTSRELGTVSNSIERRKPSIWLSANSCESPPACPPPGRLLR